MNIVINVNYHLVMIVHLIKKMIKNKKEIRMIMLLIGGVILMFVLNGCSSNGSLHQCSIRASEDCGKDNVKDVKYLGSGMGCKYECVDYSKYAKDGCIYDCERVFWGVNEVDERLECIKAMCNNSIK